mgnify:FL=1
MNLDELSIFEGMNKSNTIINLFLSLFFLHLFTHMFVNSIWGIQGLSYGIDSIEFFQLHIKDTLEIIIYSLILNLIILFIYKYVLKKKILFFTFLYRTFYILSILIFFLTYYYEEVVKGIQFRL